MTSRRLLDIDISASSKSGDQSPNVPSHQFGRCGIMTACLTDPLSLLISKILNLQDNAINAIGFYYTIHHKCTVILFNIYDNHPVSWLKLGYSMELLLGSSYITKINCYPLNLTTHKGILYNRHTISVKNIRNLEESFIASLNQQTTNNAKDLIPKHISYTLLFLTMVGLKNSNISFETHITGYTVVNRVLSSLMGITNTPNDTIIGCPLLSRCISIIAPHDHNIDHHVIEESRQEITKLSAIFIDLFTTHPEFQARVISNGFSSNGESNNELICDILDIEHRLISQLITGLNHSIISKKSLNTHIRDLVNVRFKIGNYDQLPQLICNSDTINIIDDNIPCTFVSTQSPEHSVNSAQINGLKDLGYYLQDICDLYDSAEPIDINLGGLIASYNASIENTSLKKITINNATNNTMSRTCTVSIPGKGDTITVPVNNKSTIISMLNPKLDNLSENELLDILVYIDSLRTSDGTSDTRFTNLQNEIVHEIAHRKNMTRK